MRWIKIRKQENMENKRKYLLLYQKRYLLYKYKLCLYETFIEKSVGDHIHGLKARYE